jgi:TPR repeat protein
MRSTARAVYTAVWAAALVVLMLNVVSAGGGARIEMRDSSNFAAGKQAYRGQEYAKAMAILEPLAEAGDPAAQYYVAHMYEKGDGVAKDAGKTLEWYRRSAEQGYARAQYKLAIGYAQGWPGLEKDEAEARRWLLKAAEGGSSGAQRVLGNAYERGKLGFARDPDQARYWLERANEDKPAK